jgi:macrodomain Ter protein organizer (MatP/YcbG family)
MENNTPRACKNNDCVRSGELLPDSDFESWTDKEGHRHTRRECRQCSNARRKAHFNAEYYPANRERLIGRTLENRMKNQDTVPCWWLAATLPDGRQFISKKHASKTKRDQCVALIMTNWPSAQVTRLSARLPRDTAEVIFAESEDQFLIPE